MSKKPTRSEREHWAFQYGPDAAFRDWISRQKSCISNTFGEYHNGDGRNVPCHVREVSKGAAVAIKPPYRCVPMTDEEHKLTHQHGNSYFHPKEWWQEQADDYLARWIEGIIAGRR